MTRDVLAELADIAANETANIDSAPLEIQLMRTITALKAKLSDDEAATLTVEQRKQITQKLRDTELRLAVVHERNGHPSLANPERIR